MDFFAGGGYEDGFGANLEGSAATGGSKGAAAYDEMNMADATVRSQ